MRLLDLLYQDKLWIDGECRTLTLKEMKPAHRRNLIAWLERKAERIKNAYEWSLACGPQPSGEMASDAFEQEQAALWEQSGIDWLNETPLMIELRRREAKYNSPKALKKRQRQRDLEAAARRADPSFDPLAGAECVVVVQRLPTPQSHYCDSGECEVCW
jgi:hypothetical protein